MDIFFLAVLTFYIFYKLSKHLGKIDEEEKSKLEQRQASLIKMAQEKMQEIIKQQEKIVGSASTSQKTSQILEKLDAQSKITLERILQDCKIDLSFFLTGAKSAFEMVLKAFSNGDLITLKGLLSEKIYQGFEVSINQRKQEQKVLVTNLIAIEKSEIISVNRAENIAVIVVEFISKQINYIIDNDGKVIFGNKNEITEVVDKWAFKKDISSPNPNWQISAT
jgi:predicted lipid-binding transport protein (Tim44 family)